MKDSQPARHGWDYVPKYIKANNERFSTYFQPRHEGAKYIKANNERFSTRSVGRPVIKIFNNY